MEDGMEEQKTVGRREFTVATALAMLSGVAITITESACGGSSSPTMPSTPTPPPGGGGGGGDKTGVIGANHGHSGAVITAATLASPADISLDIRGSADHPHTVMLSAAEVSSIAAGTRVSKESSTDSAHSHTVTFN
jgi:hypothetical protein